MDYQFENLGEDRFQHLCQALLTAKYPDIQSFPIRQADGGRDAVQRFMPSESQFVVYQIKYVRNPQSITSPWRWLTQIVEKEVNKVARLIPKGTAKYILMTNVPGTSHLDSGSIDRVHAALQRLGVPSQCMWRDEISRLLDGHPDLRWAFHELITGPDLLRWLLHSDLNDRSQARTLTVQAYLADQFESDTRVRFKQIELQNDLMDLFIDVPVSLGLPHDNSHIMRRADYFVRRRYARAERDFYTDPDEIESAGAASLLLDRAFLEQFPLVVLQGAPGQGKSTISQFICQIHRMRLLQKPTPSEFADQYGQSGAKLPFKIDLRDFASWLGGTDPFNSDVAATDNDTSPRTLEAFMTKQVVHHSGGCEFAINDLHKVIQASQIIIVFDGLDEVADLKRRNAVTKEITKGINRLTNIAAGVQAIVLTRPSVYSDSLAFPEPFLYLNLAAIRKPHIIAYAQRWVKAKRLVSNSAKEIKKILEEKLDQPHLADLARNPMQLAILLSLIHSRGSSLPDKRTALYDNYIDLFFSREAEKNETVRDNRDLLIHIHGHLAWLMHAESESKKTSGNISRTRLLQIVKAYLAAEQHDVSLADRLFAGIIERVVALVSRVEGTFEFEVQPLREFFAAKYLYITAPYSPPGREQQGTLPDRFDAIARSPYWLNVTRFYAGCFSKGELPALVDRIEELVNDDGYNQSSYPRILAAMLLGDWVFAQHPVSMKKIVDIVLDALGSRYFIQSEVRRISPEPMLVLPERSGRSEIFSKCFSILDTRPQFDFALSIIQIAVANSSEAERIEGCLARLTKLNGEPFSVWLRYSLHLQVLPRLNRDQLYAITTDKHLTSRDFDLFLKAGNIQLFKENETLYVKMVKYILGRRITSVFRRSPKCPVDILAACLKPPLYFYLMQDYGFNSLPSGWRNFFGSVDSNTSRIWEEFRSPVDKQIKTFYEVARQQFKRPQRCWTTSLDTWNTVIESGREHFGDAWAFVELANIAAGIVSKDSKGAGCEDLFDATKPLCERVRYARLRSGNAKWWRRQMLAAQNEEDRTLGALVLLTWGSTRTIKSNISLLQESLNLISKHCWNTLFQAISSARSWLRSDRNVQVDLRPEDLTGIEHRRFFAAIWERLSREARENAYRSCTINPEREDRLFLALYQRYTTDLALEKRISWNEALPKVSITYGLIGNADPSAMYRLARRRSPPKIDKAAIEQILTSPDSYPADIVSYAEVVRTRELARKSEHVFDVALDQQWFSLDSLAIQE